MAFDAAEITQAVREIAARHEALHERLSSMIGPVAEYQEMSTPELAKYGLEKMGLEAPEDGESCIAALEYFLHGRAGREAGVGAGMDSAPDNFVTRYLAST